jgi:hypothetical protein
LLNGGFIWVAAYAGRRGKSRGLGGKEPHARRRARESAANIEGGRVELGFIVLRRGRQEGIAALDPGSFGHTPEYSPLAAIFRKQRFGKANEAFVHIVRRYRGRNAVDVGAGHQMPEPSFPLQSNTSGTEAIRPDSEPAAHLGAH